MRLTWDEIRSRCSTIKIEDVPQLLSDALGDGPDWMVVFRDWVSRWDVDGTRSLIGANVLAFLRDSLEPTVADPEAAAILTTLRRLCVVRPRSGVGLTAVESLGEIRQTIREFGIRRADELRHKAEPGDAGKPIETAADMVERLCGIIAQIAARVPGMECDCFCGRCRITRSETPVASFRHQFRVTPVLLRLFDDLVNSVGVETRGG